MAEKKTIARMVFLDSSETRILGFFPKKQWKDIAIPGGRVDPGENPQQAAARETFEETGIKILHSTFLFVTVIDKTTIHTYLAGKYRGKPQKSKEGKPKWIKLHKLLGVKKYRSYYAQLLAHLLLAGHKVMT